MIEKDETLSSTERVRSRAEVEDGLLLHAREVAVPRGETPRPGRRCAASNGAEVLRLPERTGAPEFRILRALPDRKYPLKHALPYTVETEPGILAIVYRLTAEPLLARPPQDTSRRSFTSRTNPRTRNCATNPDPRSHQGRSWGRSIHV